MTLKMNWGKGAYHNTVAKPFPDVVVRLIDFYVPNRYQHFDVTFTDGEVRRHKRIRLVFAYGLMEARKMAREWMERNHDAVLMAQADTAPMPKSQADMMALLNQKINLQAELDQVLRDHDKALMTYDREYDRAKRGERTKSVPTGTFKTFYDYGSRAVKQSSMGEDYEVIEYFVMDEKQVEQYKLVPDYPDKPEYPSRAIELKRLIKEIDAKLS